MFPAIHPRFAGPALNPGLLSNFLLALQRAPGAPFRVGPHNLERVRIIIVERDDPALATEGAETGESDDTPEVIPPLNRMTLAAPPRLVRGEILRGADGSLYERFGNRIRPLAGLASGPRGEVLEVATTVETTPARRTPVPKEPEAAPQTVTTAEAGAPAETVPPASVAAAPAVPVAPCRALFAEPGQWRILVFGEVRGLLASHLQYPDRLRDSHRLPCYVQVYESNTAQPIAALAATLLGDERKAGEFAPLTPAMLVPLQLAGQLPPPRPSGRTPQHDRAWLLPGERVVRVTVAHDPTVAAPARPSPAAAPKPEPAVAAAAPGPKTAVPESFVPATGFVLAREEALIQLAGPEGFGARFRRLMHGAIPAAELRAWQVRLSGRSVDEQLWLVPPPAGWRHDPAVRAWAEQSLALGGYALPAMLREWEIFWARQAR